MGIAQKDQQEILQPYVSLASSSTGEKGHGLGLSIVKEFAEFLEGSLEVESTLHQGTTITINLPKTVHILHS